MRSPTSLLDQLRASPRFGAVLTRSLERLRSYWFEYRNNLETNGTVDLAALELSGAERRNYEPSGWLTLAKLAKQIRFSSDDVFADFGSGKGRIVYLAARYPLKKVIGVELSEKLNAVARQNIANNLATLRCKNVEFVTSDILDYEIPAAVTIVYLYSPFTGRTFERVIENLHDAFKRSETGRLSVVYQRPEVPAGRDHPALACSAYLQRAPWLVSTGILTGRGTVIEIYQGRGG